MTGETEIQLCARLRTWAEGLGFTVYPEVDGWDLVLVSAESRKLGNAHSNQIIEAGKQVGVHAKLRASFEVLDQAVNAYPGHAYPAYPFVAVPVAGVAFRSIARRLGVGVIETDAKYTYTDERRPRVREWLSNPVEAPPLHLPPVASQCIAAGSPSPRVLSRWRVNALRFLAHARAKGTVTATELVSFGLSKSFVDRWLITVDWTTEVNKRGKQVRVRTYRIAENKPQQLPDFGCEDVAAELLAATPSEHEARRAEQLALAEVTP